MYDARCARDLRVSIVGYYANADEVRHDNYFEAIAYISITGDEARLIYTRYAHLGASTRDDILLL